MASPEPRKRLKKVLQQAGLPVKFSVDKEKVIQALAMDKKVSGDQITVVSVPAIGTFEFETLSLKELQKRMEEVL